MHRYIRGVVALLGLAATTPVLFLPAANAQAVDPLCEPSAYSLSIHGDYRDRTEYFPLGVLFPRDRDELASYGFDFTERAVSPMVDPNAGMLAQDWFVVRHDKPTPPPPDPNHLGIFAASWAWHMMPVGQDVPGYGEIPKSRSYFDPKIRRFMLAADTALAKVYESSPATVMWSFDNEWEGVLDDSPFARAGFVDWLKTTYKTLPALNKTWGTNYQDWADVTAPQHDVPISRPAAWLDWHAYQDGYFTRFMADRYRAIYTNDPRHRGIAQKTTQQSYDLPTPGKDRTLDPALLCDLTRPYGGWFGVDIYDANDPYIYQVNFASQCIRPMTSNGTGRLFLTETNNHGGPGYEFANSIWRSLGNGVKAYDFFCFGMAGATSDSDIYGLTAPNTLLRGKASYVVRFAYDVRRTESFWTQSKPAPGVHRVALLLDRQDMLLDPETPGNEWAGPPNSREAVYAALRQAGYWVDVIPYTKLNAAFLKQYDALLLVGSDHLTGGECAQIGAYVKHGGVLVADMLAGYYDEHHRVAHGLEAVTGAAVTSFQTGASVPVSLAAGQTTLHGQDTAQFTPHGAIVLGRTVNGAPLMIVSTHGQGRAVYVATRLGELHGDTEAAFTGWLAGLLERLHVHPSYVAGSGKTDTASLRVEQPFTDGDGNAAVIVANVREKGHGPVTLRTQLPAGHWTHALWSPAESEALLPVPIRPLPGGESQFTLPAFATAGMLLLLNRHAPLIAVPEIATATRGIDGHLPALTPGAATPITVEIDNPSSQAAPEGRLTARALRGWAVTPSMIRTPRLVANGVYRMTVRVTPPTTGVLPYTERMYPLNFRWSDGAADRAVTTTPVGVDIGSDRCPWLLSENATYPVDFPRKIATHATYRYLFNTPQAGQFADPGTGNAPSDTALQGGYSRWLTDEESATFQAPGFPTVPIEFDLKDVYPLHEVRLLSSDFGGFPTKMGVSVSTDGVYFKPVGSAVPEGGPGSGKWLAVSGLEGTAARYVRLDVSLQGGGGRINEVEIWGYPK